jgi:hypothetical protein
MNITSVMIILLDKTLIECVDGAIVLFVFDKRLFLYEYNMISVYRIILYQGKKNIFCFLINEKIKKITQKNRFIYHSRLHFKECSFVS